MSTTKVPFVTLNNKTRIPQLGFGTYLIPTTTAYDLVYEACKQGYRHFDTATIYKNEVEVSGGIVKFIKEEAKQTGSSFDEIRKQFYYTTKLWNDDCTSHEAATKGIDTCLQKAGELQYIDLLLIHSPLMGPKNRIATWSAMQDYDTSKVRSIGISNFGVKHIEQLLSWDGLEITPAINQLELSPWVMRPEIVKFCQQNGIELEAYCPITRGLKLTDPTITKIGEKHGVTAAQVLLRWSLQKKFIPLVKTVSLKRMAANFDFFDFELTADEMKLIDHPEAHEPTAWECTECE
ncbi:hypothetical protein QEN19_003307 [Hanseniaspora menglaensis]